MSENTITVTDDTFEATVSSSTPTLVDFWAEWCGPCKMIAPALEEIASEYAGKLQVAKLNVDDHPQSAIDHRVQSIPTLIVFQDGIAKKRLAGARPKKAIVEELQEFLA